MNIPQKFDPSKIKLDHSQPNPYTIKPIKTIWTSNELLLQDAQLRTEARVTPLDQGAYHASEYVSHLHLYPGWSWCDGYATCHKPPMSYSPSNCSY
jgi:hypothetical protein